MLNRKTVYKNQYFCIQELPSVDESSKDPFYIYSSSDGVLACLLDDLGNFLLVRQYRQNINSYTLEFPAGGVEKGETPMEAIKREVREEVGVIAEYLPLGRHHLMINRSDNNDFLFMGINLTTVQNEPAENFAESVLISRKELNQLVRENNFFQIAGLAVLQLASIVLDVNLLHDPIADIYKKAKKQLTDQSLIDNRQ